MSSQRTLAKQHVARAALNYLADNTLVGFGTGSTVEAFIDALAEAVWPLEQIEAAVVSSKRTLAKLESLGMTVVDPNTVVSIPVYFDGADQVNQHGYAIKGGGAALTGEKIVAQMSKQFVCLVDESKVVDVLGSYPIPLEVIPMARSLVGRQIVAKGGDPMYREGVVTDHGNVILDVYNLKLLDPLAWEVTLNQIPGVVTHGIFAHRCADVVLVGQEQGVYTMKGGAP